MVKDKDFMRGYIIPAKAINGCWATIGGERFMALRFPDTPSAQAHAKEKGHSFAAGNVVFRSDPDKRYRIPFPVATFELPPDQIEWSKLPDDPAFQKAASEVIG